MSGTQEPLVEVDRLVAELDQADPPTLLDVRWRLVGPPGRDDYLAGHLPGAVFVDLDTALCGPPGVGGRHPLPDPAALQAALRAAGVRAGHPVVVYDGGDGMAAARAWWTLRWAGHRPVRLLHGGFPAWVAAGRPVSTDAPAPTPGDSSCAPVISRCSTPGRPPRWPPRTTRVLLDVRAAPRYRGEVEPIDPVAGHVPGAANLPAGEYVGPDGRFLAADVLSERFAAAGVTEARAVGAYCGSGVTAAQAVLALHLAGRTDAALYVGSWSNWVADPARPVASGSTPDR